MSDTDLEISDMIEPIERLLEREFPFEHALTHQPEFETKAHLFYVERANGIHAVRIEKTYSACIFDLGSGMHAAQDLTANRRWIALPLEEFRDGEDSYDEVMQRECKSRGIGIMTVQQKGRGLSAKIILPSEEQRGRFIEEYPELNERFEESTGRDPHAAHGWKVVNTHK